MSRPLDVVIFGASGFTGKYTILEGVKILADLKWGVAGRNKTRLERTLKEIGAKVGQDLSEIPIIVADVEDEESLQKMAEQCRVVVNCSGPFRFLGEPVVSACVSAGTHHVDVSGEPQYMEKIQLEYHEKAQEKGVYIVSACGFDSIPADLGVIFLEREFGGGVVNSVEAYLDIQINTNTYGPAIHYATWESAVHGLSTAEELHTLRKKLFKERLPRLTPTLKNRPVLHKNPLVNKWCLPFMGSDRSVVMRSQRYLFESEGKRPVQMRPYFTTPSLFVSLVIMLVGMVFGVLTRFCLGRSLLLRFPRIFSLGFVSHEGPSEETMENSVFSMYFQGRGWSEANKQYKEPPNKKLNVKVSGTNPGYGATCVAVLLSAVTILKEQDRLPKG